MASETGMAGLHAAQVTRVALWRPAGEFAMSNSDSHVPNETGGIVLGRVRDGVLVVSQVTGPGPRAIHQPSLFIRDGEYAQQMLEKAVAESGGWEDYAGEWHSHPFSLGPSAQDRASMRRISENPAYVCSHPILLLCRRFGRDWRLEAYQWESGRLASRPLEIVDPEYPLADLDERLPVP